MLRRLAAWIAALMIGVALGGVSAWAAITVGSQSFMERYGAWSHSRAAGASAADPYTRAVIAREGLLALSAREAVYFSLDRDAEGNELNESCVYDLVGAPLAARWWSVTLYARDGFLVDNNDHAPSVDATRLGLDQSWSVRIAPVQGNNAHWISSRGAGRGFSLMLRVYNPQRDFTRSAAALPTLNTVSCAGRR